MKIHATALCLLLTAGCSDDRDSVEYGLTTAGGITPDATGDSGADEPGSTGADDSSGGSTGDSTGDDGTTGDSTGDPDPGTTGEPDDGTTGDDGGGNDICNPSQGAGGALGLSQVVAAAHPDIPATLYVPSTYSDAEPVSLMIALHGSGDTAGNFTNLWDDVAESEGFIVLVPESLSGGASWNTGTDPVVISDLLDEVRADYNIDECAVYLTGYSAGAHVTYVMGLYNSEFFAALGIQAGTLQFAEQAGVWPNDVPRTIPVDIHHGSADGVVPVSHAQYAKAQLEAAGHLVHYTTHPGGHEVGPGNAEQMWANLRQYRLDD
jgi:dienelactone hydrolase